MWTCVYACIFTVCAPYVHVYTWKCACMLSLACDTAQMPFCMFLYLQIDIVHVCNSIIYIESILTQIDHQLCLHMTHANCPLSMKNAWKYSALCPCMNALLTVSSLFAFVQPPPPVSSCVHDDMLVSQCGEPARPLPQLPLGLWTRLFRLGWG